jgi:vacuolar protein sorting-associated protein 13A/C
LATHYKDNLTQQLLKILGSIEIIGNPVGLVKNIGIGVYDLFDKPIEGFIKGPIEGGIGIGKGAGSLVKNVVSGTSNSVGKISGAIASGCSTISMDP